MKDKFNPPKWKCAECGEVIQSQHPGHYVSCYCGSISVDYISSILVRRIGKLDSFIEVVNENIQFFKAKISLGLYGTDLVEYFEAESKEDAEDIARDIALDWADSFGFEQNEEVFGDLDSIGKDFDEDSGEYEQEGSIEYVVTEISEEEHNENLQ